jgi:uncharacterized protein (TIGR03083 family)
VSASGRCNDRLVEAAEVPQEVARLRREFADRIVGLDETAWDKASWCSGWRVRDVLAHLVRNAESTSWSLMGDLFRGGFRPDHSVTKAAMRLRGVQVSELADRLREAADERLRSGGSSKPFGMGDVVVHSADAFRPLGEDVDVAPTLRRPSWMLIGTERGWSSTEHRTADTAWWRRTLTGPEVVEPR